MRHCLPYPPALRVDVERQRSRVRPGWDDLVGYDCVRPFVRVVGARLEDGEAGGDVLRHGLVVAAIGRCKRLMMWC